MELRLEIIDINLLKEHEETREELYAGLLESVRSDGELRIPILVDEKHFVILDGHHRYKVLKALGCKKAPVYLVDYFDPDIELGLWPTAIITEISKQEVIDTALSGKLYTPKTTKHVTKFHMEENPTPLSDLF